MYPCVFKFLKNLVTIVVFGATVPCAGVSSVRRGSNSSHCKKPPGPFNLVSYLYAIRQDAVCTYVAVSGNEKVAVMGYRS
jgi:hypothetical protein